MNKIKKLLVLFFLILNPVFFDAQENKEILIQMALNLDSINSHVKNQSIINTDTIMTIHFDELIKSENFVFMGEHLEKFKPQELDNWNFNFTKVNVNGDKAEVIFEYYPIWKNCNSGRDYLAYSNTLFFRVFITFNKNKEKWEEEFIKIIDINFESWMNELEVYKCIINNYKPLK